MFDRNNHKLVTGTDYTVSYSQDVRNVGVVTVTITGIGNYMGTVERAYNITPAPAVIRVNDSSRLTARPIRALRERSRACLAMICWAT